MMEGVLGGCLAPVLVDAVLELYDGEVAHFQWQRSVEEDGLSCVRSGSASTPLKMWKEPDTRAWMSSQGKVA